MLSSTFPLDFPTAFFWPVVIDTLQTISKLNDIFFRKSSLSGHGNIPRTCQLKNFCLCQLKQANSNRCKIWKLCLLCFALPHSTPPIPISSLKFCRAERSLKIYVGNHNCEVSFFSRSQTHPPTTTPRTPSRVSIGEYVILMALQNHDKAKKGLLHCRVVLVSALGIWAESVISMMDGLGAENLPYSKSHFVILT